MLLKETAIFNTYKKRIFLLLYLTLFYSFRPKFLPYKYLYMYRKNYYDDVMDYLDKRARGVCREIPRAQTWAERVLRTFSDKVMLYRMYTKRIQSDLEMVEKTKTSGNFYYYHVKHAFNRQFSPLLY